MVDAIGGGGANIGGGGTPAMSLQALRNAMSGMSVQDRLDVMNGITDNPKAAAILNQPGAKEALSDKSTYLSLNNDYFALRDMNRAYERLMERLRESYKTT